MEEAEPRRPGLAREREVGTKIQQTKIAVTKI